MTDKTKIGVAIGAGIANSHIPAEEITTPEGEDKNGISSPALVLKPAVYAQSGRFRLELGPRFRLARSSYDLLASTDSTYVSPECDENEIGGLFGEIDPDCTDEVVVTEERVSPASVAHPGLGLGGAVYVMATDRIAVGTAVDHYVPGANAMVAVVDENGYAVEKPLAGTTNFEIVGDFKLHENIFLQPSAGVSLAGPQGQRSAAFQAGGMLQFRFGKAIKIAPPLGADKEPPPPAPQPDPEGSPEGAAQEALPEESPEGPAAEPTPDTDEGAAEPNDSVADVEEAPAEPQDALPAVEEPAGDATPPRDEPAEEPTYPEVADDIRVKNHKARLPLARTRFSQTGTDSLSSVKEIGYSLSDPDRMRLSAFVGAYLGKTGVGLTYDYKVKTHRDAPGGELGLKIPNEYYLILPADLKIKNVTVTDTRVTIQAQKNQTLIFHLPQEKEDTPRILNGIVIGDEGGIVTARVMFRSGYENLSGKGRIGETVVVGEPVAAPAAEVETKIEAEPEVKATSDKAPDETPAVEDTPAAPEPETPAPAEVQETSWPQYWLHKAMPAFKKHLTKNHPDTKDKLEEIFKGQSVTTVTISVDVLGNQDVLFGDLRVVTDKGSVDNQTKIKLKDLMQTVFEGFTWPDGFPKETIGRSKVRAVVSFTGLRT